MKQEAHARVFIYAPHQADGEKGPVPLRWLQVATLSNDHQGSGEHPMFFLR